MDSGWHAIGVRLSGPRLDGWVPSSVITQIYDVNMAVTHSGWGLHYLSTGDSLWIEAAHHSLRSTNAYGQLYALIAIPDTGDFYTRTELLGALPAFGGEDAFLAAVLRVC